MAGEPISLPVRLWHGGGRADVRLPDDWRVEVHRMRGGGAPIGDAEIAAAIASPLGTPPLTTLATGRKKAVVLFDDLTRPTRADQIAPHVVAALTAAGLPDDKISFVCALGAHGALSVGDLRKKLGDAIVERFRVYNHNAYSGCVNVGTTSRGTPLWINGEVMAADLKIGIGGVTPHPMAGFSGGGKIVLPGVARMDSIEHFHIAVPRANPGAIGFGRHDGNPMRADADEAARRVGLDFKVDVVFNEEAVAVGVFAGDFVASQAAAAKRARRGNALPRSDRPFTVAVVNAHAKANELTLAVMTGLQALSGRRGTIAVLADAPDGQVVHYLMGRFGESYGGSSWPSARVPDGVRLIVQAPRADRTYADWFANPEVIAWTRDWDATLALLRQWHGPGTEAVVIPEGTIGWYVA